MDCPDKQSTLFASNLETLTWSCEACWAETDRQACSSFLGPSLEKYIEGETIYAFRWSLRLAGACRKPYNPSYWETRVFKWLEDVNKP